MRPLGQQAVSITLDPALLLEAALDSAAYGRVLTGMRFADPALTGAFAVCRAAAPAAPELHALPWETLRDPQTDYSLALSEQVVLTRALGSAD